MASQTRRQPPSYCEELALLNKGYRLIAGLDEVGRGTLAGPVVAGVVMLPPKPKGSWVKLVRDSKQMSSAQRDQVMPYIQKHALSIQTGLSTAEEIDDIGIAEATLLAMRRALHKMPLMPQFLLLDAFPLPGIDIPQNPILKGDALCLSIAAASVVAKVTRDRMMLEYDLIYPGYGFAKHKGYATEEHRSSIERLGPCDIHRYSFAPIKQSVTTKCRGVNPNPTPHR